MLAYSRIGITVKSGLDDKCESVNVITRILRDAGAEVFMDPKRKGSIECATDLPPYDSEEDIDLLVVIGGDGTILRAIRELRLCNVPILAVNRGAVGFLTEITLGQAPTVLPRLLHGQGTIDERRLLYTRAYRDDQELFAGISLNEAVIAQGTIARIVELKTTVDGEPLTSFRADGLIVATPTGSTAYSLAAGGPIVHPRLNAIILTPINPHSFSQKPIVIDGNSTVEIEVHMKPSKFQDTNVILTLDGQTYVPLERRDRVVVTNDDRCVKFLRQHKDPFFGTLREKLRWGEGLNSGF